MKATIHVTEDDPDVRELISATLSGEGFEVLLAGSAAELRNLEDQSEIDLFLLDLTLPDDSGFSLAKEIRESSDAGIIIVTGRAGETDQVLGLELGADDYITKPFRPRELLARVHAVLRRRKAGPSTGDDAQVTVDRTVLQFLEWRLDLDARSLHAPDAATVPLTTAEFELLLVFVESPKRVHSRDFLLDHIHGREWAGFDRGIDGLVSRLRKKIEADPRHPEIIKTVRGVGYIFASDVTKL